MVRFSAFLTGVITILAFPFRVMAQDIPLVQPLDDSTTTLSTGGGLAFIVYFETFGWYLYVVAVGFCTLWVVIGGILIMVSGSDGGKRDRGKKLMTTAIQALALLTFGGFILRTLNNIFFV